MWYKHAKDRESNKYQDENIIKQTCNGFELHLNLRDETWKVTNALSPAAIDQGLS